MNLKEIIEEIKADPKNEEYTKRGIDPIFQVDKNAKILLIGQAPGRVVEETGIPFNDKSGDKLRKWMGINREQFYSKEIAILPMDFYYPGKAKQGDLPPRKFMADVYHEKILEQMPNVELTILIGAYSQKYYLGKNREKNLTETVKNYKEYLPDFFPIVHPSPLNIGWLKKNPWFEKEAIPDLQQKVKKILS
ncbi:uracil-DNA glycosylase family protein [Anaerococcus sp. mt242]|uniref:uracil-DNA glycosylase family protein n=1 Tax=Anaerococcus sp. mt242 TaxID=2661917 RepID=UPI001934723B|nr:uracil-DNA glycosylase family protein [Anaerococcus sp. mt242]MBM0047051.1 uracil-DNA glycosylase family protein [Anaerococcus sp. mt242]